MGFDIDINLTWFRGNISKLKKNPQSLSATEHAKLGLVINGVKFS